MAHYTGIFANGDSPFGHVLIILDDDQLKAEVGGLSIKLLPVAPDTFNAVDAPFGGPLVFERVEGRLTLRLLSAGVPDVQFTKSDFTPMERGELAELAGAYHSVELDATYEIAMADRLSVTLPGGTDHELTQAGVDEFVTSGWRLVFDRDRGGTVTGFTMNAGRVRSIRFVRN
jgi:hypothetical protein